jgi:cytochrome c2/glucose/arabinose dehydrogenase
MLVNQNGQYRSYSPSRFVLNWIGGCLLLIWAAGGVEPVASGEDSLRPYQKIVMLAGPDNSVGLGDSSASSFELLETLQDLLENSTLAARVRIEVHAGGWPQDPATLEDADSIALLFQGVRDEMAEHPLAIGERWDVIRRHVARGRGLMLLGDALDVPAEMRLELEDWMGAALPRDGATPDANVPNKRRMITSVIPGDESHPITFGWTPFSLMAEVGGPVTIDEEIATSRPVLRARVKGGTTGAEDRESEILDEESRVEEVIGWSWQHAGGSRGFGCTLRISPEHFELGEIRRILLGGMAWTAKLPIPPAGLDFEPGKPIRALVVTGDLQPRHVRRETTESLRHVLRQDERMDVEVIPDPEFFRSPQLFDYDVVLLNDRHGQILEGLSDPSKENLLLYLTEGGGLVMDHLSQGAFPPWRQEEEPVQARIAAPSERREVDGRSVSWVRYGHGRLVQMELPQNGNAIPSEETAEWICRGTAWAAGRIPRISDLSHTLLDAARSRGTVAEESLSVLDEDHFEGFQEEHVVDNRFREMDTGPFLTATVATPGGETWKGVVVRVGDQRQVSVCFDTELLRVSGAWDGFLNFSPARFGLIQIPSPASDPFVQTPRRPGWSFQGSFADPRPHAPHGTLPREWGRYHGLHLHGERVVIRYEVDGVMVWESPWWEEREGEGLLTRTLRIGPNQRKLEMMVASGDSLTTLTPQDGSFSLTHGAGEGTYLEISPGETARQVTVVISRNSQLSQTELERLVGKFEPTKDLEQLSRPGPRRWLEILETQGERGEDDAPYVLDTLTMPYDNPYGALMFASGHDFFSNGDAAVCTVHGDVWRVSGISDDLGELHWQRFATGLFQPLGLLVVDDRVHVVGRDQITILHDENGDGEADYYQNFNNDGHVTANGHEYVACLERDSEGWFYFLKGDSNGATAHDGCLLRVSPDGETLEVFATGIRNGNGLGIGPGDIITLSPQEGNWTPASAIFEVRQGGFHGAMPSHHREVAPETMDPPLCWIPRPVDNSSGGQTWVTSDRWGPLEGALLHFSFGRCRMMVVLRDTVNGQPQGGVSPLPLQFLSGSMRGRFRDHDGQLYVTGLMGWVTSAVKEGCFQRVRYTGRPAHLPRELQAHENGLLIRFTDPLEKESAEDIHNFTIQQWQYRWSGEYGSPEFRPSDERRRGRDLVPIRSATLLDDGRSLFLEIPDLRPVMQMSVQYALRSPEGTVLRSSIDHTIHQLRSPYSLPPRRIADPTEAETASSAEQLPPSLALPRKGIWLEYRQPPFGPSSSEDHRERSRTGRPDVRQAKPPGERVASESGARKEAEVSTRHAEPSRLVAWDVAEGETASSFLAPGPFSIHATGWIQSPLRGLYRFRLEGSGAAELTVNGFRVLDVDDPRDAQRTVGKEQNRIEENPRGVPPDSPLLENFHFGGEPSIPIRLNSGWNRIELKYTSRATGEGRLRLLWSGEGTEGFAEEPVPPEVLAHVLQEQTEPRDSETRVSLDLGRELHGRAGCANCHAHHEPRKEDAPWQPFQNQGPDLSGAGDRYEAAWLHRWLLNPTSLRNDVWMPTLLKSDQEGNQQAADLVAYLGTLRQPRGEGRSHGPEERERPPEKEKEHENEDGMERGRPHELEEAEIPEGAAPWSGLEGIEPLREAGATLYERRGCIACHHLEPPEYEDPYDRVSLHYVRSKQSRAQLTRFLQHPHQFRDIGARMPDFQLSAMEARALTAFLFERSTGKLEEGILPEGDPLRGGRLFHDLGCVQCHSIQQLDVRSSGPKLDSILGRSEPDSGGDKEIAWLLHSIKRPPFHAIRGGKYSGSPSRRSSKPTDKVWLSSRHESML